MKTKLVEPRWLGAKCVVAASGPGLTTETASLIRSARCHGWHVLAVNDAYTRLRYANALYAADWQWWQAHDGAKDFHGERWSCTSSISPNCDDKSGVAEIYGLTLVEARDGVGFSRRSGIYLGACSHSGFHAVNLALILGCERVVLAGFDLRRVDGEAHFFGEHPNHLRRSQEGWEDFVKSYPADSRVVNATPESALRVYEFVDLEQELFGDDRVPRDGPKLNTSSDRIGTG